MNAYIKQVSLHNLTHGYAYEVVSIWNWWIIVLRYFHQSSTQFPFEVTWLKLSPVSLASHWASRIWVCFHYLFIIGESNQLMLLQGNPINLKHSFWIIVSTPYLRLIWLLIIHLHDDNIKWKHFSRYCPFVWGIHWSQVNSPYKGQWHGALMFSMICARINGWVNNGEAGDLRHHHTHYDITVMENNADY